ncbi:hypothetical protein CBR_g24412 [Chara braunii]|uniref:Uncharacterized protein n=1 Tax=Chara braunii TaxID=69332 RepID=A0A388JMQ6_CHABU|nr:hypothetical protein CBR_g24412 [Chara braunii]|eukprot:GBG59068.1 hypothetical protein CBR_g24412 [Chara braunii]
MVETRTGLETNPYSKEQQEKMAALVRENKERKEREKQAKLKAIANEQAAKMKRLEEEMKRVQQEEEERRKAAEAEAAAEEEKERMRIESGEGSSGGTMKWETNTELEKKINEWVAYLSLGEDEEAESYVTKDEKAALAAELAAMTDPMERREREDEQKLAWKLRMKREKKRRREEVNKMTAAVARVQECRAEVLAQPDDKAKWDKVLGYLEVLSKAWMEERQASWSQDVALSAMRSGFRDFAREIVTHIGGEVKQLRDNVGKFCEGAIQGAKAVAAAEGEARPRKDPVKLKFPDAYGGKKEENFENWEASANSYIYLQHILAEEQVLVAFQALKDEAASFARSLARTTGCENNLVAYSKVTPLSQFLKLLKERFADPTRGIGAFDKLQTIHFRQWRSAKALKGTMDDLVAPAKDAMGAVLEPESSSRRAAEVHDNTQTRAEGDGGKPTKNRYHGRPVGVAVEEKKVTSAQQHQSRSPGVPSEKRQDAMAGEQRTVATWRLAAAASHFVVPGGERGGGGRPVRAGREGREGRENAGGHQVVARRHQGSGLTMVDSRALASPSAVTRLPPSPPPPLPAKLRHMQRSRYRDEKQWKGRGGGEKGGGGGRQSSSYGQAREREVEGRKVGGGGDKKETGKEKEKEGKEEEKEKKEKEEEGGGKEEEIRSDGLSLHGHMVDRKGIDGRRRRGGGGEKRERERERGRDTASVQIGATATAPPQAGVLGEGGGGFSAAADGTWDSQLQQLWRTEVESNPRVSAARRRRGEEIKKKQRRARGKRSLSKSGNISVSSPQATEEDDVDMHKHKLPPAPPSDGQSRQETEEDKVAIAIAMTRVVSGDDVAVGKVGRGQTSSQRLGKRKAQVFTTTEENAREREKGRGREKEGEKVNDTQRRQEEEELSPSDWDCSTDLQSPNLRPDQTQLQTEKPNGQDNGLTTGIGHQEGGDRGREEGEREAIRKEQIAGSATVDPADDRAVLVGGSDSEAVVSNDYVVAARTVSFASPESSREVSFPRTASFARTVSFAPSPESSPVASPVASPATELALPRVSADIEADGKKDKRTNKEDRRRPSRRRRRGHSFPADRSGTSREGRPWEPSEEDEKQDDQPIDPRSDDSSAMKSPRPLSRGHSTKTSKSKPRWSATGVLSPPGVDSITESDIGNFSACTILNMKLHRSFTAAFRPSCAPDTPQVARWLLPISDRGTTSLPDHLCLKEEEER